MKTLILFLSSVALFAQSPTTLSITGGSPSALSLTAEDLSKMPRRSVTIPDASGKPDEYEGVLLNDLLQKAGIDFSKELKGAPLATYIVAGASDGYQVVFSVGEIAPDFGNATILSPTAGITSRSPEIRAHFALSARTTGRERDPSVCCGRYPSFT